MAHDAAFAEGGMLEEELLGEIPEEGLDGGGGFCGHMDIVEDLGTIGKLFECYGIQQVELTGKQGFMYNVGRWLASMGGYDG